MCAACHTSSLLSCNPCALSPVIRKCGEKWLQSVSWIAGRHADHACARPCLIPTIVCRHSSSRTRPLAQPPRHRTSLQRAATPSARAPRSNSRRSRQAHSASVEPCNSNHRRQRSSEEAEGLRSRPRLLVVANPPLGAGAACQPTRSSSRSSRSLNNPLHPGPAAMSLGGLAVGGVAR